MRLIADSGSTKTQWVLLSQDGTQQALYSQGINPYFLDSDEIQDIVKHRFQDIPKDEIEEVIFYGAGCALADKCKLVHEALVGVFEQAVVQVYSDLLAAAHALFGNRTGLVCILGTGSNTAVYNGANFDDRIQSLGYLLGDEGSGGSIGRKLLQAFLRGEMPSELQDDFAGSFSVDVPIVLNNIYKKPFPNRYLAGFASFAGKHKQHVFIQSIIRNSFKEFIKYQLEVLQFEKGIAIGVVGSIAYYFQDILNDELNSSGYSSAIIIKEPIHELVRFHFR